MPPKQVPETDEGGGFAESFEHHLPDKSREFEYHESTEENIGGKSQHFHYEGNDLPEKE